MLKTVIEHVGLPFFLLPSLIPHPHPAAADTHQRQVEPQLFIRGAVVGRYVGVGYQGAEEGVVVVVRDAFLDEGHSERDLLAIVVELHVVQLQVEDVPLATVNRLMSHPVLRLAAGYPRWAAVGLEPLLVAQGQYLIADLFVTVLEAGQPRKLLNIPYLLDGYHQGCARSPGVMSGQPFCSGLEGYMCVLLIFASSQGLTRSTFELVLSEKCTLMNLVRARRCNCVRKQESQKALSLSQNRFSTSSSEGEGGGWGSDSMFNLKMRGESINFYQKMPDTIYDDLKQQGLQLSEAAVLGLPPIRPPKPTLVRQLGSFLAPQFNLGEGPHKLLILPILNSAVLIARANTLIFYKFEIDKETGRPVFLQPKIQNLGYAIRKLHICDSKFLNDRGEVPFLVEAPDRLVLFYVDLKQYKIVQKNTLNQSKLFSVRFICEKEVLILNREFDLQHFIIQNGNIKMKTKKMKAGLPPPPADQYIHHCQIVGSIDEEQDSLITLFYLIKKIPVHNPKNPDQGVNFEILKVKEYVRTFEGKIEPQEDDYTVISNTHSSVIPEDFDIWCFESYFCVQTKHEVLILKKKFKKYLFIDNVMENIHGCNLKINPGAIISSYNTTAMELSVIQFGDPKCVSKMLDTVDLDSTISPGFKLMWPFKNEKETCLMLAFEKDRTVVMYNVLKMEPMKKMLEVVKGIEKSKISMVQEIAVNLGISKKDFYFTLWQSSKRELPDINTYLLPCGDVSTIKKEIRLTLRRKKILVTEFIKILEKIGMIIRNELKTNLSQQMLKEYIKNDFLLRKVKLKEKDKYMDHRDLQKVYDSSIIDIFVEIVKNILYPETKKVDPLHAMVDVPVKESIDLRHVFQEFRIAILENYKTFIVAFMSKFEPGQIINVIEKYSYLLPSYPFELTLVMHENDYKTEEELKQQMSLRHNGQSLWFSHMTSVEFNRELSKERIERELHEYYPTSRITDAINTLVNSPYGAAEKLRKHGLISCTIEEYKQKLKEIYNIKLFLKVCEYANQIDAYGEETLSPALVEIFRKQNRLTGPAYEDVRLYTSMHKFMLAKDFCEKKANKNSFSTEELIQFTNEDLIALFFLENRQRKEFIFNEFRDLYINLYSNPDKFNSAIKDFIQSDNCSRIELEIFIKEVSNKGVEFQIDNQALIGLLIDGFCKKLEIREDTDTKHFIELMEEIELSKALGIKLNKIIQIRRCLGILNIFNCEKFTYLQMLEYQQGNEIFKKLLEKYFNQEIKRDSVRIEDEEISLEYCRNMLTVLLYILETIYYDVEEKSLLLTYGEILIDWKQFDVIKGILYDEEVLQKLKIDKNVYIDELVRNCLHTIYTDQSIEFDEEVKKQIEDILDILPEDSIVLREQELAKLNLVQIFESWEVIVHPFDIYSVCLDWNDNGNRDDFIINLFDVYLDKLTLENFKAIYSYLEYTADHKIEGGEQGRGGLNNSEFVKYVLMFAQRLLKIDRYAEIIDVFAFVTDMKSTIIEYELMTEAFLKQICNLYPEDRLEEGRELIEYFIQNYSEDGTLHKIFEKKLIDVHFNEEMEREKDIMVDTGFCFRKDKVPEKVFIGLDLLWKLVVDYIKSRKDLKRAETEEIYYSYYFLLTVFKNPKNGLGKLDRISYNLQITTKLLQRLDEVIDEHSSLWAINTYNMFKYYFRGLIFIGIMRVKKGEKITDEPLKIDSNVEAIKNFLKENKAQNKDLLDSMLTVEALLNATKATKKTEKELRFERSKLTEIAPKEVEVEVVQKPVESNTTMTLRQMRDMKYEYTQMSNLSVDFVSERQLIEMIYQKVAEEKEEQARKVKRETGGGNNLFLTGINNNGHRKDAVQKDIIEKIPKGDGESILKTYPKEEIINAVRAFYEEGTKDFHEVVDLLEILRLGEPRKISLGKLCKYYNGEIPIEDLPRIFPFDFFLSGAQVNDDNFREAAYQEIAENIQGLLQVKDNEYVRSTATFIGTVLEANAYIERVYLDTLIHIVSKCNFSADMIVRFRTLMEIISAETIKDNIANILAACREREDMRVYIKKELELWVKQVYKGGEDLMAEIRLH